MYTIPPRTLKAPAGVWFSCFIHTSHPARWLSRGHEYCGVGGTNRWTSSAADSSSAKEGSTGIVATGMWIRCPVGQIGHIFEDLPKPVDDRDRSSQQNHHCHHVFVCTQPLIRHCGAISRLGAGALVLGYMTHVRIGSARCRQESRNFWGRLVSGVQSRLKAKPAARNSAILWCRSSALCALRSEQRGARHGRSGNCPLLQEPQSLFYSIVNANG